MKRCVLPRSSLHLNDNLPRGLIVGGIFCHRPLVAAFYETRRRYAGQTLLQETYEPPSSVMLVYIKYHSLQKTRSNVREPECLRRSVLNLLAWIQNPTLERLTTSQQTTQLAILPRSVNECSESTLRRQESTLSDTWPTSVV